MIRSDYADLTRILEELICFCECRTWTWMVKEVDAFSGGRNVPRDVNEWVHEEDDVRGFGSNEHESREEKRLT